MHLTFIAPSLPILVILILAHLRVLRLQILDSFPPIAKLRDAIYLKYPPEGSIYTHMYKDIDGAYVVATDPQTQLPTVAREDSLLGELLSCVWCSGFWVAVVQAIFYVLNPVLCVAICLPFAISMATGMLWKNAA